MGFAAVRIERHVKFVVEAKPDKDRNEDCVMGENKEKMADAGQNEKEMIEEVMRHLDQESMQGVYRMSVTFDEEEEKEKEVSHACCHMYGRPASETVGLLDMYTDMNAGRPDRE